MSCYSDNLRVELIVHIDIDQRLEGMASGSKCSLKRRRAEYVYIDFNPTSWIHWKLFHSSTLSRETRWTILRRMRISEARDNAWSFQFGTVEVSTKKVKDSLLRIIKLLAVHAVCTYTFLELCIRLWSYKYNMSANYEKRLLRVGTNITMLHEWNSLL